MRNKANLLSLILQNTNILITNSTLITAGTKLLTRYPTLCILKRQHPLIPNQVVYYNHFCKPNVIIIKKQLFILERTFHYYYL